MDLEKLNYIKQEVLKEPLEDKKPSNEWCGIYVIGESEIDINKHFAPFHAFNVFSEHEYPIYLFVNQFIPTQTIEILLEKYNNIKVIPIKPLDNSFQYNYWFINYLWYLLPDHPYCVTFQEDGFLIRSGFENDFINNKLDYVGATWKEKIKLLTSSYDLPYVGWGNGGFSLRRPSKMKKIVDFVNNYGGQEKFIKGMVIEGKGLQYQHPYCNEDIFFSAIGLGLGIFNPCNKETVDRFTLEPISYTDFLQKKSYGFHRIDE